MSEHTAGPWTTRRLDVLDRDGSMIATCMVDNLLGEREELANTRLIAAAPEMYETLAAMYAYYLAWMDENPDYANRKNSVGLRDRAAAVLLAVDGRVR